jgi:late competence protein required for DNA uptake (superfamily II DNA/RNA helicase)
MDQHLEDRYFCANCDNYSYNNFEKMKSGASVTKNHVANTRFRKKSAIFVFVNHMRYPVGRIIALNPDIAQ